MRTGAGAQPEGEGASAAEAYPGQPKVSQDLPVLFKAFDRIAYSADYNSSEGLSALESALGGRGDGGVRIVPVATGRIPAHGSYIVK